MNLSNVVKGMFLIVILSATALFSGHYAEATQEYAQTTGKGCKFCHAEGTGGPLNETGFAYARNGYRYPIPERILKKSRILQSPFHKVIRFIIGYIHLLAAVVFFGAIFYIHIFVGPRQFRGGIPRHERILGLSCMALLTFTGVYLTWARMDRWANFFNNTFGLMLLIKIVLFVLMVAIGLTAVTIIHRKMKKEAEMPLPASEGKTPATLAELRKFDGQEGRKAYFAHEGKVYDVTGNQKWKGGRHFGKHNAGEDLTNAMNTAPHGKEVLNRVESKGELGAAGAVQESESKAKRIFVVMAYVNLIVIFLILACISVWRWDLPLGFNYQEAGMIAGVSAAEVKNCVDCHENKTPGIYHDWRQSVHSSVGVDCYDCHKPDVEAPIVSLSHLEHSKTEVSLVVTPKRCSGCHPKEAEEYARSKHAHTLEIIWSVDKWLQDGMNNAVERTTGCYSCHGSVVEIEDGRPVAGTWPNVGVGRKNPDGSLGSCSSCHTRHLFSSAEARKPEACDQCHLGPDHPQIEIYNESKHGTIYHAQGDQWNWRPENRAWKPGEDYRAPTCAVCHISAVGDVKRTHDQTERLSWETQAPLTVRPADFKAFPAGTDWRQERNKMKHICLQCHSVNWTEDHFDNLDNVIHNYNEVYFVPVKSRIDELYDNGLLSREKYFDEPLEWEFYEFWHHEGRRARMGAAMMAPDYAWWHGFYEMKHRFTHIMHACDILESTKNSVRFENFPGRHE